MRALLPADVVKDDSRAGANRYPEVLTARVSQPRNRHFPHESNPAAARRPSDRRVVGRHRRALGGGGDEHRRHSLHGCALRLRPKSADNSVRRIGTICILEW